MTRPLAVAPAAVLTLALLAQSACWGPLAATAPAEPIVYLAGVSGGG
jgi:hypothetical protein